MHRCVRLPTRAWDERYDCLADKRPELILHPSGIPFFGEHEEPNLPRLSAARSSYHRRPVSHGPKSRAESRLNASAAGVSVGCSCMGTWSHLMTRLLLTLRVHMSDTLTEDGMFDDTIRFGSNWIE